MIDIEIVKAFEGKIKRQRITSAVQATLNYLSIAPTASLSILITTDQQIQELNQKYRGIDQPTDVLAFPAGHTNPEDGTMYLGDIILSYPRAEVQAAERGHQTAEEIQLLVIHGVLHLLHFDHADAAEKQEMWHVKSQILQQLNIAPQVLGDR